MPESQAQAQMREQLIAAARADPRIVGLLNDGSHSRGCADAWSDLDVSVFLRDEDFEAFTQTWVDWASQFGALLLAYISHVGHPWTVYAAAPVPLRVDFDFHRAAEIERVAQWPVSPSSVEAMLWYDGTGGQLRARVEQLVGKSLRPANLQAAFDQQCGDLWYELLHTFSQLRRGGHWVARQTFHCRVLEALLFLLRLEAGAVEQWQATPAARAVEGGVSPERLQQLNACIPGPGPLQLHQALQRTAVLGRAVCVVIAGRHGWSWPQTLAGQTVQLLSSAVQM